MIICTQSTANIFTFVFLASLGLVFINVLKMLEDFNGSANYSVQALLNDLKIRIMSLTFDKNESRTFILMMFRRFP